MHSTVGTFIRSSTVLKKFCNSYSDLP